MSSTMTVVLFDPYGCHALVDQDEDTKIIHSYPYLRHFLRNHHCRYLAVGICSLEKSEAIQEIVKWDKVKSIWLCKDKKHGNREKDPLYHTKVQDEIVFHWDENDLLNFEFWGHIDNCEKCLLYNNLQQFRSETQAVIRIKHKMRYRIQHPHQPEELDIYLSPEEFQISRQAKK